MGATQVLLHGVASNILSRQWYNPGLASALFGHLPLAILYISYIHTNGLVSWLDYVIAIIYMVIMYVFIFRKLLIGSLANENSSYPFTEKELAKYKRWDKFNIKRK
ncbi:hypothetical protein RE628_12800 [Paenibacillus sp. D2_2]|uniref:HXXEE domain-containing protein n=1 Tax=Paenibacillus sp. D2_2 TaxID=3073092 RepID=UPI002816790B|nr:HXXEE domain-containing protein [Paenibacillus sp. D2_2]WMT43067.1 hypothetical protein RE628_12800 [Paenibacillus sp. D2_2]